MGVYHGIIQKEFRQKTSWEGRICQRDGVPDNVAQDLYESEREILCNEWTETRRSVPLDPILQLMKQSPTNPLVEVERRIDKEMLSADERWLAMVETDELRLVLQQCEPEMKEIIKLLLYGKSQTKIAEKLGVSDGMINKRKNQIREKLEKELPERVLHAITVGRTRRTRNRHQKKDED